jgi:hypothetical protein
LNFVVEPLVLYASGRKIEIVRFSLNVFELNEYSIVSFFTWVNAQIGNEKSNSKSVIFIGFF